MTNIFENAYFGKAYKTRDGSKALYLGEIDKETHDFPHRLALSSSEDHFVNDSGMGDYKEHFLDIVSEWQVSIDKNEIDKLSEKMYPYEYTTSLNASEEADYINDLREAFKKGYSAALKQ